MGLALCLSLAACGDLAPPRAGPRAPVPDTTTELIHWSSRAQNPDPIPEPERPRPVSRRRHRQPLPPVAGGGLTDVDAVFECIKRHESGGNYANKRNPAHRGAYQFSFATWRSVGGTGDPADAPPAEQDARARELQRRSGWGQWSVHRRCGV